MCWFLATTWTSSGIISSSQAERGGGRKYRAYDLLKSESGFSDKIFKEVWKEIFAFCLGRTRPH